MTRVEYREAVKSVLIDRFSMTLYNAEQALVYSNERRDRQCRRGIPVDKAAQTTFDRYLESILDRQEPSSKPDT